MAQRTANAAQTPAAPAAPPSAWDALRYPVFRSLWIATVVSNVGTWMYNAASGWLMTSLEPESADRVAGAGRQQPAAFPVRVAGRCARRHDRQAPPHSRARDPHDRTQRGVRAARNAARSQRLAAAVLHLPARCTRRARDARPGRRSCRCSCRESALSSAVAVNSVGVNISRVLGPALTGAIILALGIAAPFWLDAFSNAGVIAVICCGVRREQRTRTAHRAPVRCHPRRRALRALQPRAARDARARGRLLPLRERLLGAAAARWCAASCRADLSLYGTLLAPSARARSAAPSSCRGCAPVGPNGVVALGEAGTAVALVLFGLAQQPWVAVLACLLAGLGWIGVLAILNVSAQTVLPDWVRGRGLAVYVTVFFGTMTIGSALWGVIAEHLGSRRGALPCRGRCAARAVGDAALEAAARARGGPDALDALAASRCSPTASIRMQVRCWSRSSTTSPPSIAKQFLRRARPLARERRRDGAYDWNVFQDTAHPERMLETFLSTPGSSTCASISGSRGPTARSRSASAALRTRAAAHHPLHRGAADSAHPRQRPRPRLSA